MAAETEDFLTGRGETGQNNIAYVGCMSLPCVFENQPPAIKSGKNDGSEAAGGSTSHYLKSSTLLQTNSVSSLDQIG